MSELFVIRPMNEEQNYFIITVGKHLATPKHFKSRQEAERYIRYPKWDTIIALLGEIKEVEEEMIKKDAKTVVDQSCQEVNETNKIETK